MPTLSVSHYIYLNKSQRYDLHNGKEISVIGISVPVWFDKGNTTEPAQEYFCKYKLINDKSDAGVKQIDEGFSLVMPYFEIVDEKNTTEEMKKIVQRKLGTTESLLDVSDGGIEISEFKVYQKLQIENELYHLIHFVEIKAIDILLDTIS
jgi:hypothetical protein